MEKIDQNFQDLVSFLRNNDKPVVLFLGAGTSTWAGYPLWEKLAQGINIDFQAKLQKKYNSNQGNYLIEQQRYPELFELCKQTSPKLYRRFLSNIFRCRTVSPIYERLLTLVDSFKDIFILTTNIDHALYNQFSEDMMCLDRYALEDVPSYIADLQSFTVYLHGTGQDPINAIFASSDYQKIIEDHLYRKNLQEVFKSYTTIFIGYGFGDDYILEDLKIAAAENKELVHYYFSQDIKTQLPNNVKQIKYTNDLDDGHTELNSLLFDVMLACDGKRLRDKILSKKNQEPSNQSNLKFESTYFISDIFGPNLTLQTSYNIDGENVKTGEYKNIVFGTGLNNQEIGNIARSIDEIIIGLVCFETITTDLYYLGHLYKTLTDGVNNFFDDLIKDECFQFINFQSIGGIQYDEKDDLSLGALDFFSIQSRGEKGSRTKAEIIRDTIKASPGKEDKAEVVLSKIEERTIDYDYGSDDESRRTILKPLKRTSVRDSLGISYATAKIPHWYEFPYLKSVHLSQRLHACRHFNIPSIHLQFGFSRIAESMISNFAANNSAGDIARYIIAGDFRADLSKIAYQINPDLFSDILKYRQTSEAEKTRKTIIQLLDTNESHELKVAINNSLKRALNIDELPERYDSLLTIKTNSAHSNEQSIYKTFVGDVKKDDQVLAASKHIVKNKFLDITQKYKLKKKDKCPCNSGLTIRDCCGLSLGIQYA